MNIIMNNGTAKQECIKCCGVFFVVVLLFFCKHPAPNITNTAVLDAGTKGNTSYLYIYIFLYNGWVFIYLQFQLKFTVLILRTINCKNIHCSIIYSPESR